MYIQCELISFKGGCVCTLRDSEAFRSSLMTAERASGLIPCSHSLTHMDRDSISKPVLSNLEISSNTVGGGSKNRHIYDTHAKTYYIYFKMNFQLLHKYTKHYTQKFHIYRPSSPVLRLDLRLLHWP